MITVILKDTTRRSVGSFYPKLKPKWNKSKDDGSKEKEKAVLSAMEK